MRVGREKGAHWGAAAGGSGQLNLDEGGERRRGGRREAERGEGKEGEGERRRGEEKEE